MLTRFVTLCLGPEPVHAMRCTYALLSVLAHAPDPAAVEICVCTDRPQAFRWFGGRVRVLAIDQATFARWKGPHDYFFRTEIEVLRHLAAQGEAHLVYLDSDIIVTRDLGPFLAQVAAGTPFMHLREREISTSGRAGIKQLWSQVRGKAVDGMAVPEPCWMWNAGVMAVSWDQRGLVDRVAMLCDGLMAQGATHWLVEQLSYSLVFGATGKLAAAEPWMVHWWGNKPGFDAAIARFLLAVHQDGANVDEAVHRFHSQPIRLPLVVRKRWWHRLLRVDPRHHHPLP